MYRVLDLFAGAGGFSFGFSLVKRNGKKVFDIVRAVEKEEFPCKTLENHLGKDRVMNMDLTLPETHEKIISECGGKIDVIIGGPPCQTFSLAGPARSGSKEVQERLKNDQRNLLFIEYIKLVEKLKPTFVVFENVEGIASKEIETADNLEKNQKNVIDYICSELNKLGYTFESQGDNKKNYILLNAVDYGVPQKRKRIFLIGNNKGILNPCPNKTHFDITDKNQVNELEDKLPFVTTYDAIGDLPPILSPFTVNRMEKLINIDYIKCDIAKYLELYKKSLKMSGYNPSIFSLIDGINSENLIVNKIEQIKDILLLFNEKFSSFSGTEREQYSRLNLDKHLYENANIHPRQHESRKLFLDYISPKEKEIEFLTHHTARAHNIRDIVIFILMLQGTNSAQFLSGQYENRQLARELSDLYPYNITKHKDTYVKHDWKKPSNTILSHLEKDGLKFIHPSQPRTFSAREAARLQSFPDYFVFEGNKNWQFIQIGNAVPPLLAKAIGEAVYEGLLLF